MRRAARAAIVVAIGGLAVAVFFRAQIQNHFTLLFGDRYDGVIVVALLEHWHNVLRGLAAWNVTGYFHPHGNTLGYNDGYLLYGLIYTPIRMLGADPFLGAELTYVAVKLIGFFSFHLAARRIVGARAWAAALGATLFVLANNSLVQASHVQLLSVCFAPLMALLMYRALESLEGPGRVRATAWGLGAAFWYSAWLLTSFYMAWFFGLYCIVLALAGAVAAGRERRRGVVRAVRREGWPLATVGLGALVSATPFLYVYLSTASRTGMHAFGDVVGYTPSVLDVLNVGTANLLYGSWDSAVNHWLRPGFPLGGEWTVGVPPLTLLGFLLATAMAFRHRRDQQTRLVLCVAIAALALWVLALHVRDFTAWRLVYWGIPGARAIRVVARVQIFLMFPIAMVLAWALSRLASRWPAPLLAALGGVLVLEQINLSAPVAIDRRHEMAILAAIGPPPEGCKVFYAATTQPPPSGMGAEVDDIYGGNVAAMLVATYDNIPTINGFSTFTPPDWDFAGPGRADYQARVDRYAARYRIANLCGLNFRTNRWEPR
jgi:hypothetical protein